MARAKTITMRGRAERHSDAIDLIPNAGDAAIVYRGGLRSMAIRCPDGCGEVISVNLDPRTGPAWRLFERAGAVTLYPSVWRETGCEAHFILWRDDLIWCDGLESPRWKDDELKRRVRNILPPRGAAHKHFEELAVQIDGIPWEVLWACNSLVADGIASSSVKGSRFGLAPDAPPTKSSIVDRRA